MNCKAIATVSGSTASLSSIYKWREVAKGTSLVTIRYCFHDLADLGNCSGLSMLSDNIKGPATPVLLLGPSLLQEIAIVMQDTQKGSHCASAGIDATRRLELGMVFLLKVDSTCSPTDWLSFSNNNNQSETRTAYLVQHQIRTLSTYCFAHYSSKRSMSERRSYRCQSWGSCKALGS